MTSPLAYDMDHPQEVDRFGFCTRCFKCIAWKFLEPRTTPSQHVEVLCPVCVLKREPSCRGNDV